MKYFPIFRPGKHVDSNGVEHEFTVDAVKQLVDDYNSNKDNYDVPLVKGHPKTDDPAFGWVDKLKFENGIVYALPKMLDNAFKEEVQRGAYRYVSVKIGSDGKLKHVGFLGAANPAIKQLGDVKFAEFEGDGNVAALEDCKLEIEKEAKAPDIQKEFSDLLSPIVSQFTELKQNLAELTKKFATEEKTNSNNTGGAMEQNLSKKDIFMSKLKEKFGDNVATQVAAVFEEAFSGVKFTEHREPDPRDLEIEQLKKRNRLNDFKEFISSETKLAGKQVTSALEILEIATANQTDIEFTEGSNTKKIKAIDLVKDFLKSIKNTEFGSTFATGDDIAPTPGEPTQKDYEEEVKNIYGGK